ncbi:MAG: hypothetical protein LBB23_04400 [Rickettsiales bacterium]|nr:hypothetical protein [Rickettsiales bacterium]
MIKDLIHKCKAILPATLAIFFIFTPSSFLNPGGIIALIPIFYFLLISEKYMPPLLAFALIMFLDYMQNSVYIWTFIFMIFVSVESIQKIFVLREQKLNAAVIFTALIFIGCILQWIIAMNVAGLGWSASFLLLFKAIFAIIWTSAIYIPASYLFRGIFHDR